jgi:uroporphyrinogen decarboxylase
MYGHDEEPRFSYAIYGAWEFGGEIKFPSGQWAQAPTVSRFPVQSEADISKLELPDVKKAGLLPMSMEFSRLAEESGSKAVIALETPFTTASNICGLETLCRWTLKKPELVHRLLRLATDHLVEAVKYWVDSFGAERVMLWEGAPAETNQLISPVHFKKFAFPYVKEFNQKALDTGVKHIFCHICGDQNENLPFWSQMPMGRPGIVSVGPEVNLSTAIEYFGNTCIVAGNIDPAIIQTGTPPQVYELCRQAIEKAKHAPGGFILMPGCELSPVTPPYNVYVMKKAVDDFGRYG